MKFNLVILQLNDFIHILYACFTLVLCFIVSMLIKVQNELNRNVGQFYFNVLLNLCKLLIVIGFSWNKLKQLQKPTRNPRKEILPDVVDLSKLLESFATTIIKFFFFMYNV